MAKNWKVTFHATGTSSDPVYDQKVTMTDETGVLLGTYKGSSTPNPYKPREPSIKGELAYPWYA